jgi:acyl-homoserine-lactone acylase
MLSKTVVRVRRSSDRAAAGRIGTLSRTAQMWRRIAPATAAAACASVCMLGWTSGASAYTASLTRTTGGVANIEASTLGGGGFGTGYAQAQDGICTLAEEYLTVSGERSAFFGPSALNVDLYWASLIQEKTVENLLALPYPKGPSPQARELAAGFAAGYDKYLSDIGGTSGITDPRCVGAKWVRPINEIDVWRLMYKLDLKAGGAPRAALIAAASPPAGQPLARVNQAVTTGQAVSETEEALGQEISLPGSNGLGIGSEDAANGGGLVIANPHFPWVGSERFWESHIDIPGTYDVIGASLWGSPVITIGHNQHVAWTHTVSTNITTTNWTLKLVPGHSTQYLVDGKAVSMTFQDVTVQVLEGGVLVPHAHRFYYSKYGPILASPAWTTATATAFDDGNATNLRAGDQWLKIGQATSSQQLVKSEEEIQGVPWVNTIGSDDKGSAFYTEIAVTPNLPTSYLNGACNLSPSHSTAGPFDGSKSECELGSDPDSVTPGIFGASNEPKLIRKDYAENSNNSFWLANANQLLTGFSPALGNENANPGMRSQTGIDMVNQRMGTGNGGVPTDGLGATPGFTAQKLQESWASYRAMPAERALPGLREICENAVKNSGGVINKVNVSAACPILNAYDATAKLNSPGGWLFNRWWASAPTTNASFWVNPWTVSNPIYTPNTLNTALAASQNALATAVTDLETRGIPLNASFGQVQYTQRATKIPIPGCSDGSMCFAVINSSYDNSTAKTAAVNGSSSSIVMFTELDPVNGPLTKGLLTYSQSEDITSPFYEDQTLRFSKNEWITLPWTASQVSADAISPQQALSTEPGAPTLSAGTTPNANGLFTLSWTGPDPAGYGIVYTLQHRNAVGEWTNVATGLEARSYQFTGAGEGEGTWTYRVQGSAPSLELTTEWSPASEPIKVDKTVPNAPSANPDRAPDYAGGGGWYANSVTVSFSDNGDPLLSDASAGSGVDLGTLSGPQTFNTDGAHEASGTVADNVGNVSSPGTLSVQVDVSAPSVEASCPAPVSIGAKGVNATVAASDGQSGLAKDPSGSYPINTSTGGVKTVTVTAIDNVGHETEASCSTLVGYTQVITGNVKSKLVVKKGQAIKLTKTAKVSGPVTVQPGGALDVEGATISGSLTAKEATLIRVCDADVSSTLKVVASSGSVVIGEGNEACGSSNLHGTATLKLNKAGVLVNGNVFYSALKVLSNEGGTTVIDNTIAGEFIVKGNTGTVVDTPNEAEGKVKIQ